MRTWEIFEGVTDHLTGYVDVQTLAGLLPDIDNPAEFQSALNKLRLGQGNDLTIAERKQLSLAFISFIGLEPAKKAIILQQTSAVKATSAQILAQTQQNSPSSA
jgi:hypothetical protein